MMDLTPLEVRKKKGDFRRQIRGYDPESVDDFLDLAADRLEHLVRENAALSETSQRLERQVGDFQEREKALTEALVSAQQIREEMRTKAAQDAQAARSEAEEFATQHRTQAAQEAEEARRAAQATVQGAEQQAARELERARAEARRELDEARAAARETLEQAKATAHEELERIRTELTRIRDREERTIRTIQERRAVLLDSYRDLLERERANLEQLPSETDDEAPAGEEPMPALPDLSPALLAAIEAAQFAVEDALEDVADAADEDVANETVEPVESVPVLEDVEPPPAWAAEIDASTRPVAAEEAPEPSETDDTELTDDIEGLLLEEDADIVSSLDESELVLDAEDGDDSWLSSLVRSSETTAAQQPPVEVERSAIEAASRAETDEDFIDTLIAQAGVAPMRSGNGNGNGTRNGGSPPIASGPRADSQPQQTLADLLGDDFDDLDIASAPAAPADSPPEARSASAADADEDLEMDELDPTAGFDDLILDDAADAGPSASVEPEAEAAAETIVDLQDGDEDFDAMFEDADDDPTSFDFDAALANATGVSGRDAGKDTETPFDLGVEFDEGSPLDLGRGGAGAFDVEDLGRAPFSRAGRPPGLTLRPLSPEEEAPDLPIESRRPADEGDDDMFSTMFGGR